MKTLLFHGGKSKRVTASLQAWLFDQGWIAQTAVSDVFVVLEESKVKWAIAGPNPR
jgi:hypothetical protein